MVSRGTPQGAEGKTTNKTGLCVTNLPLPKQPSPTHTHTHIPPHTHTHPALPGYLFFISRPLSPCDGQCEHHTMRSSSCSPPLPPPFSSTPFISPVVFITPPPRLMPGPWAPPQAHVHPPAVSHDYHDYSSPPTNVRENSARNTNIPNFPTPPTSITTRFFSIPDATLVHINTAVITIMPLLDLESKASVEVIWQRYMMCVSVHSVDEPFHHHCTAHVFLMTGWYWAGEGSQCQQAHQFQ